MLKIMGFQLIVSIIKSKAAWDFPSTAEIITKM